MSHGSSRFSGRVLAAEAARALNFLRVLYSPGRPAAPPGIVTLLAVPGARLSRPAAVYLVMIVVLIAGLWAVLAMGSHLVAPEDLAGKWKLQSIIHGIPDDNLDIEQSGRFYQVSFESGTRLNLKWTERTANVIQLGNGDTKLTIAGLPDSDDKTIELSGSHAGRWAAHRISRAYPWDVSGKEGS